MDKIEQIGFNKPVELMRAKSFGKAVILAIHWMVLPFSWADPAEEFRRDIIPIIEKHCYDCHGEARARADLNLEYFAEFETVLALPEIWHNVFERVQSFEMPPPDTKYALNYGNHQRLTRWLRALPKPERPDCDQLASDRNTSFYRGYVMSRRLNRAEYNNTVRDLFGVDLKLEEILPADGGGGEGFDTSGHALFTSSIHIEKYLDAAERAVESILTDSADGLPLEIAEARERLLVAEPGEDLTAREAARQVVSGFARRAFRRPVAPGEIERMLVLFDRRFERGDGYIPSLRLAVKGILISPNFLFLAEPEPEEGGVRKLGPYPLASRLSYFLWSSMPDEELFSMAETGKLLEERVYLEQIRRMLEDPKAEALGERFGMQWLDLQRLGEEIHPDPQKFPEYDQELGEAMQREFVAFFNYLFRSDRSLLELIDSDYTFLNQKLAEIYGIEGVIGAEMQRVSLTDRNRGGVLGMPVVHALTSYPLRTSPVLRGRWILESLLGDKVNPPPPDVPALEEETIEVARLSLREQLELHRTQPDCAACHVKMDPLGFGLENFDVLGRWRETDRGQAIDTSGVLPSGESFEGPTGLKSVLMAKKDEVLRHLVRKMTGFAYGRELNKFDQCVVDRAMEALEVNDYRASVLVEQIATSFPFLHRFYPKQENL
jgi:hypothetical protein